MAAVLHEAFRQRVADTREERARVRRLAEQGRWQRAEANDQRFRAFAARRTTSRIGRGAEAMQGDTLDYQPASFLSEGATVRRAVAYVEVNAGSGSTVGTGFMVSPGLFLTNQHVIADAAAARGATITFDRELDEHGRPRPTTSFLLDPVRCALFSPEGMLDYALLAVGERLSGPHELPEFGWCALSAAPDKHVLGMSTNIIQHPGGQRKLISIRRNLLVARTPTTLLYETDTELGSSGAPVFNDDWDVVALHHYGEPFLERTDDSGQPLPVNVNEGIRISALVADIGQRRGELPAAGQALLDALLQLGEAATLVVPQPLPAAPTLGRQSEAVRIDTRYANRGGYDAGFIPGEQVPLPALAEAAADALAPLRAGEPDAAAGELKYQHFSICMNRHKRMALYTATNLDGDTYLAVDRQSGRVSRAEADRWFIDPRISESFTLGQSFYSAWSTYFDRGHLTRRTDPTWGSAETAERANADTFHFTNCCPQHFRFNQSTEFWQGLERYVLENGVLAQHSRRRLCVLQGPIFDDRIDRTAGEVQIPSSFFKLVVWRGAERLKAVGLVVDQGPLLDESRRNLGMPRAVAAVNVNHWRVPVALIEQRTGLDFGAGVREADTIGTKTQPLPGGEALRGALVSSFGDIVL